MRIGASRCRGTARGEPRLGAALRVRDEGLCGCCGVLVALVGLALDRVDEGIDLAWLWSGRRALRHHGARGDSQPTSRTRTPMQVDA